MRASLAGTPHDSGDGKLRYFQEAIRRVRQIPGVRNASVTEFLPMAFTLHLGGPFTVDGRRGHAMVIPVLPDYFRTMGGQIVYGRDIRDSDVQSDSPVAMVNDLLAKEFGGPAAIVGHQIQARPKPITIVGVVRNMVYIGEPDVPQIYEPDRTPGQFFGTIVARVDGRPENRLAMTRDAVKSVDPRIAVYEVKTLDQLFDEWMLRPKVYSATVLFFAGFALLLALIGIYGVVSYTVEYKTHEMGVRLALGSTPSRLRGVMLRQALITVICGAVPGVVGAILAGRFIQSLVDGARPAGIGICGAAFVLIATTAAAACWMATRRMARLDIMEVLRAE
jgi:MacB-like periplasmic core domain